LPGLSPLSAHGSDGFVLRLGADDGTFGWARKIGSRLDDRVTALASGDDGLYMVAQFSGEDLSLDGCTQPKWDADGTDSLVAKLNADALGKCMWARRLNGTDSQRGSSLALSTSGVAVGGYFSTMLVADSEPIQRQAAGAKDGYLLWFNRVDGSSGIRTPLLLGSAGNESVDSVSIYDDTAYIAGSYGVPFDEAWPPVNNAGDLFLAKLRERAP
jgi:hypothetical protein